MAKKWTDEEIQFLKFAYPNKDFTTKEIAEALNRSKTSVISKANSLGLLIYKEKFPENHKKCSRCENILPMSYFTKRGDAKHRYRSWCRACRTYENKEYRIKTKNAIEGHAIEGHAIEVPSSKKCRDCNEVKPISEFYRNKNNKDKYDNYCKKCSNIRKEKSMLKKLQERGW